MDARIKVLRNEKNLKVGKTRNKGLEIATGDYIHFLDSDDYLDITAYQTIVNTISEIGQVDIIHFLHNIIEASQLVCKATYKADNISNKIINIYNTPDAALNWNIAPWGKIIKKDFLINNQIFFKDYPYTEDVEPSVKALVTASSIYFIDDILYSYRINIPTSLMSKRTKYPDYDIKCWYLSYEFCKNISKKARQNLYAEQLRMLADSLYTSYSKKYIDYKNLKKLVCELDNRVLKYDFTEYNWYTYYKEIIKYPEFIFLIKVHLRSQIKKYIPKLHKLIIKNKNRLPNS